MNKTNLLLIGILAILVIGLFVGLGKGEPIVIKGDPIVIQNDSNLGFSGYNELGYTGAVQTTTDIRLKSCGDVCTNSSTTAYKIFDKNPARMYAEIQLDTEGYIDSEARIFFGDTTATATYPASSSGNFDVWALGMSIGSTTNTKIILGPDNLWKGAVWGIADQATVTVRTIEF